MDERTRIRDERREDYKTLSDVMWDQVVYLRTGCYLLRQIAEFPLKPFTSPDDRWFLAVVHRALYEAVLMGISKLLTDVGPDVVTIRRGRNIVLEMLKEEFRPSFKAKLKESKLEKSCEDLANRVREIRNGECAHLLEDSVKRGSLPSLDLTELEALLAQVEHLYQPLLFGASATFLPDKYDPEIRAANPPAATDIERILLLFARESFVVNEPEIKAPWWDDIRTKRSREQIAFMNHWRVKCGLPEA